MDKYDKLDSITKSLNTVNRMSKTYKEGIKTDKRTSVKPSRLSVLQDMLTIASEYNNSKRSSDFSDAIRKSSTLSNTYKGLKHHLSDTRNGKVGRDRMVKTMELIKPVMSNKTGVSIGKAIRIYEILKS